MQGQQKTNITEQKVPKFSILSDSYEVISNDATIKIVLRPVSVMEGSMERDFFSTKMWIKEGDGWVLVNNTKNYNSKEEFIKDISSSEHFTQAIRDYEEQNVVE